MSEWGQDPGCTVAFEYALLGCLCRMVVGTTHRVLAKSRQRKRAGIARAHGRVKLEHERIAALTFAARASFFLTAVCALLDAPRAREPMATEHGLAWTGRPGV